MAFKDGYVDIPLEFMGNRDTWRLYWDSYLGRKLIDIHDKSVKIFLAAFPQNAANGNDLTLSLTANGQGFEGNINSNTITAGTVTSFTLAATGKEGVAKTVISGFAAQDATVFFDNMLSTSKDYDYAISLLAGDTVASVAKGAKGNAYFDTGAGNDTVTGGVGDDTALKWQAGNFTFDGGKGSDTIQFISEFTNPPPISTGLVLDLKTGVGTGPFGNTLAIKRVENVIGTVMADVITGTAARNIIGDGMFDGGADSIKTAGGNDIVRLTTSSIGVDVDGGTGRDELRFTLTEANFILDLQTPANSSSGWSITNFEVFTISKIFGTGQWTFTFRGSEADETVNGSIAPANGFPSGGALYGRDFLHGGGGKDVLNGLSGNDQLWGDAGADSLSGGKGADQFVYLAATDSQGAGRDTIVDFSHADGDRIDLQAIFAGDLAFVAGQAFSGVAGEVRATASGGDTLVEVDLDGGKAADFSILLKGGPKLVDGDFIL